MNRHAYLKAGVASLLFIAAAYGMPAFAAKDVIYPSEASAMINGAPVTVGSDFAAGANGHTALDNALYAGDAVKVTATWKIQDNSGHGTNTSYPRSVGFSVLPAESNPVLLTATLTSAWCTDITSSMGTCTAEIDFSAPAAIGGYVVEIAAADSVTGSGSNTALNGRTHVISFSVELLDESVQPKETKLTVDPKCVLFNGDVNLTATLEELAGGVKIENADISYEIDSILAGSAVTGANGIASLLYNVTGLGAGDHILHAAFSGSYDYLKSNDTNTLGISYLFMGFGQPINGDGSSIFSGRVIPIKIKLVDAFGLPVTDAEPTVWLAPYDTIEGVGEELKQVSSVAASDTDNVMRYVPEDRQYVYNWDTKDLENGTYAVVVELGDSPTCRTENPYAIITVAKKGGRK